MENLIFLSMKYASKDQILEIGTSRSQEMLEILYITIYLAYFDKIFLLNVSYKKEIIENLNDKLKCSPLINLTDDALSITDNRIGV